MVRFAPKTALYDSTPVENMFIQEFMPSANGDFVKVYLYGLMYCHHPIDMTIEKLARDLGVTEDIVTMAYEYWENKGLVTRVADNPATFEYNLKLSLDERDDGIYKYAALNEKLNDMFVREKGRILQPQEIDRVRDWIETLGFDDDAVLEAARVCVEKYKGKKATLQNIDKKVREWAAQGIRTRKDIETANARERAESEGLASVFKKLGLKHNPSEVEIDLFNKWLYAWGFTIDAVLLAVNETTKGRPSMAYLDGILDRQHKEGRHEPETMKAGYELESSDAAFIHPIMEAMGIRGIAANETWKKTIDSARGMGYTQNALIMMAGYVSKQGGSLDDLERVMTGWHKDDIVSEDKIEKYLAYIARTDKKLAPLFKIAGYAKKPTPKDRAILSEWEKEGYDKALVEIAAEFAQGANHLTTYMDAMLRSWRSIGVRSVEAARTAHANRTPAQASEQQGVKRPSKEVAEHRYDQRTYTDEQLNSLFDIKEFMRERANSE